MLGSGRSSAWLRWRLTDREWVRVLPGTYITHTGRLLVDAGVGGCAVRRSGRGARARLAGFEHRVVRREPQVVEVVVPSDAGSATSRG